RNPIPLRSRRSHLRANQTPALSRPSLRCCPRKRPPRHPQGPAQAHRHRRPPPWRLHDEKDPPAPTKRSEEDARANRPGPEENDRPAPRLTPAHSIFSARRDTPPRHKIGLGYQSKRRHAGGVRSAIGAVAEPLLDWVTNPRGGVQGAYNRQ